jgi:hypothetical protein
LPTILLLGLIAPGCTKPATVPEPAAKLLVEAENGYIDSETFDNTGGDLKLYVGSNYAWAASVEEGVDWIELSPWGEGRAEGGKYAETEVMVLIAPSDEETERTAVITFSSRDRVEMITITQGGIFLTPSATELYFSHLGGTSQMTVSTNALEWDASVAEGAEWFDVQRDGRTGRLTITAEPYDGNEERSGVLRISTGGLSKDIPLVQVGPAGLYEDGDVVQLQEATTGAGINIIFMGDGYTLASMIKDKGKYESDMRLSMEHFFSVYPYTEYRHYFNVWMVVAVSEEEGISVMTPRVNVDTALGCRWYGEGSTGITCSRSTVKNYARLIPDDGDIDEATVIIPINVDLYAGTCYMELGMAIAMCPVLSTTAPGASFQNLLVHESNGHAFGKLGDEYINEPNANINDTNEGRVRITQINEGHADPIGGLLNISLSGDIAESPWAGLAGNPKYTGLAVPYETRVGMFEGASYHGYGAWRSEPHSCMDYNYLYFNAPSRWAIVRRIMAWSDVDEDYTIEEFIRDDVMPEFPEETGFRTRGPEQFIPLAPPIFRNN